LPGLLCDVARAARLDAATSAPSSAGVMLSSGRLRGFGSKSSLDLLE
jgi:hypothetical protein